MEPRGSAETEKQKKRGKEEKEKASSSSSESLCPPDEVPRLQDLDSDVFVRHDGEWVLGKNPKKKHLLLGQPDKVQNRQSRTNSILT